MNVWRWFGLFLVLAAALCLGGPQLTVYAGKDKDKDKDKGGEAKDKDKKDDKDKKGEEPKKGGAAEELKFNAFDPKGKSFFQEIETNTTQTMNVMGQDVTQKQLQTFYVEWTP